MSKRALCLTAIEATLAAAPISISATNIEAGRNVNPRAPSPYVLIRPMQRSPTTLLASAGKIKEYSFDVDVMLRARDLKTGKTIDAAVQDLLDSIEEAFDGKCINDFPTLTGLRTVRALITSVSDAVNESRTEYSGIVNVIFEFTEAN